MKLYQPKWKMKSLGRSVQLRETVPTFSFGIYNPFQPLWLCFLSVTLRGNAIWFVPFLGKYTDCITSEWSGHIGLTFRTELLDPEKYLQDSMQVLRTKNLNSRWGYIGRASFAVREKANEADQEKCRIYNIFFPEECHSISYGGDL